MANFLNGVQVATLEEKDWTVKPSGCWVQLHSKDCSPSLWLFYANTIGFDASRKHVKILVFGVSTENN